MKPIAIVKLGTGSITDEHGVLDESVIADICTQLATLSDAYNLILVTSGAIGCGKSLLPRFTGTDAQRRVAASVGNPVLIQHYQKYLQPLGISVAQALLERHHFSDRSSFLTLRETFEEWWAQGFLPIVNENDVVSDVEIRFSDNDELATLIAVGFSAEKLFFGTNVEGVKDGETVIQKIDTFSEDIFSLAEGTSSLGLGGMISKLNCAKFATKMGTEVVIFNAKEAGNILRAEKHETGTICPAQECSASTHQRWMASGGIASGKVFIDEGAAGALAKRKSLLAVGVTDIAEDFVKGEFIQIYEQGETSSLAIARAKISSQDILALTDKKGVEIAHADEIILF
jgi:glutamate 5-kinase